LRGTSIATRIGTGKKAKQVELKHLFRQQLVALKNLRAIKIHNDNPADIFLHSSFQHKNCNVTSTSNTIHTQASDEATYTVSQISNCFCKQSMHPAHTLHTLKGRARWATRHFNMEYFNNIFFAPARECEFSTCLINMEIFIVPGNVMS